VKKDKEGKTPKAMPKKGLKGQQATENGPKEGSTANAATAGGKKKQVHRRQITKDVRIALQDPKERERLTKILLTKLKDLDELRIEAANVAAGYREKLKDLKAEIDGTSDDLRVGIPTPRLVEEIRNFSDNSITTKDVANGTVYEKRMMNEEDNQIPISDLPNAEADDEEPKEAAAQP